MGDTQIRTRRALLTAAASGAAVIAANAALPAAVVRAADQPLLLNVPNTPTAGTGVAANIAGPLLTIANGDPSGAGVTVSGTALGVSAESTADEGKAVLGAAGATATGVYGAAGDYVANGPASASYTGVFGYSDPYPVSGGFGSGVWGASADVGVYGQGDGAGVYGDGGTTGTGVLGYSGSGYGLWVDGKVNFSKRAGKFTVAKGKTSYTKTGLTGITSGSVVIAVFQGAVTGTWIRGVKAGANSVTVYFSRALPAAASIGWIAVDAQK